jgi:23S rRNA pseudouridine1911/1915/1917 synthase
MSIDVIYEDDLIVVLNKKRFIHCFKGQGTALAEIIEGKWPQCTKIGLSEGECGLVNRLDYETSGIVIVAKSAESWSDWRYAFKLGQVKKEYLALVQGSITCSVNVLNYLGSRYRGSKKVKVSATPKARFLPASSSLLPIAFNKTGNVSLVKIVTLSGRRHQVRVHCSEAGFPLVGDSLYGGSIKYGDNNDSNSFFLHAWKVKKGSALFEAPIQKPFANILQYYGLSLPVERV